MTIDVIKENLRRITDSKYVVDLFLAVYGENRELERRYEMTQKEITRLKAEREMLRKLFELQNQELRKLEAFNADAPDASADVPSPDFSLRDGPHPGPLPAERENNSEGINRGEE